MRATVVLPAETLYHVAARTLGTSSYASIALYAQAIVAANPLIVDWTALAIGQQIALP
ncbi:MAG: hypothetical protein KGI71_04495 [Patescibacteria group bacterium]|nr:hypothetical protein [Patescibacteria group bacterium]